MTLLSTFFVEHTHLQLKPYYANWFPDRQIELGDFGYLTDDLFIKKSNLRYLNIKVEEDEVKDEKTVHEYRSKNIYVNNLGIGAKGQAQEIVDGKVSIEINFSNANSVFFNAAGCTTLGIKDLLILEKKIKQRWSEDKWNDDWYIVTQLVRSSSTTIILSESKDASITLEAKGKTSYIDLADANLQLHSGKENNIGYKLITQKAIPLLAFHKFVPRRLGRSELSPYYLVDEGNDEIDTFKLRQEILENNGSLDDKFELVGIE